MGVVMAVLILVLILVVRVVVVMMRVVVVMSQTVPLLSSTMPVSRWKEEAGMSLGLPGRNQGSSMCKEKMFLNYKICIMLFWCLVQCCQ